MIDLPDRPVARRGRARERRTTSRPDQRAQRLPRPRRRHGDEPPEDDGGDRRRARPLGGRHDGTAGRGRAARRDDGGQGQLRRHSLDDRPRHGARPRRGRAGRRRCDGRGVPRRGDERVPRGEASGGGDDADRDPRDGRGGGASRRARASGRRRPLAGRRAGRRRGSPHARDARQAPRGGRRRRRRRRPGRARPRRPPRAHRRAAARRAGSDGRRSAEESIHHEESEYRYCTVFVVEGEALDLDALHASLEPLGDSLLVTGDASVAKVHVHTDEPEGALDRGRAVGVVDAARVEIGDMHSQASERERWLAQLHAAAQAPPARGGARRGRAGRAATATSSAARERRS